MAIINRHLLLEFQKRPGWDGLTEMQKEFFLYFFAKQNVFLTGPAGTGKSFCINELIDFLDDVGHPYGKTATTGVAALNIGGTTIHSWAGIGLADDEGSDLLDKVSSNKKATNRIKGAKLLIIDEISMAKADLLEKIDIVCQFIRNSGAPFGGLQIVFVGDFCLKVGTKVLMFDGSLKQIEEIRVGDVVMGPDSKPRNVLRTFSGESAMYKVEQANAETYYVTGNHKISLRRRGNSTKYKNKNLVENIPAKELTTATESFLEVYGGYKAGCIEFPEKRLLIDPYILGVWLGDGETDGCRICSADSEIIEECQRYSIDLGLMCKTRMEHRTGPAQRVSITSGEKNGLRKRNPFRNSLRTYGLIGNKHIPNDYLTTSSNHRLKLLAGLIDTDGCLSSGRFCYCSIIENLARQVKFLADHLGFRTNLRRNSQDTAWEVSIGGDIWKIPTKIQRKRAKKTSHGKTRLNSTVSVSGDGIGKFAGFETDGDHMFVLEDGTVTHNCQLPPVFNRMEEEKFAFDSDAWKSASIKTVHLTEIVRQHDDPEFARFLNEVRLGTATNFDILEPCMTRVFPEDGIKPVRLFCKNYDVDAYNNEQLSKIDGKIKTYHSIDDGPTNWKQFFDKNCRAPNPLHLKVGAQVMLLTNLAIESKLVNGSVGVVEKMYDDCVEVRFANGTFPIEPFKWEMRQNEINVLGEMTRVPIASRKQIPLKLAWAVTSHKCQGATLDRAEVDASEAFACGQIYVMLSRVRDLSSLKLKRFNPTKITVNKKCLDFYRQADEDKAKVEQFFETE